MGWPFWGVVCLLVAMTALVVTLGVLFAVPSGGAVAPNAPRSSPSSSS